ncbi:MAG: hypothetical protein CM1200mP2_20600 [Planctomycetaceae bacterium]|nr:MAG: hypothetical protein CM1200mP2_20600 [Planctomycetaceae bacterium]
MLRQRPIAVCRFGKGPKGGHSGPAGDGQVRVSGVRLSSVIRKLGVHIGSGARFLTAEGKDAPLPGKEDFEHSLPLDEAIQHSVLATRINGQPIPAVHGGPVRLMTPGFYGTMHIKWVSRLRFENGETDNYNQIPRYRVPRNQLQPGKPIKYTFANSTACWRMKTKCVVLAPEPDAAVAADKPFAVRGWLSTTEAPGSIRSSCRPIGGKPGAASAWRFPAADLPGTAGRQPSRCRPEGANSGRAPSMRWAARNPWTVRFTGIPRDTSGMGSRRLLSRSARTPRGTRIRRGNQRALSENGRCVTSPYGRTFRDK